MTTTTLARGRNGLKLFRVPAAKALTFRVNSQKLTVPAGSSASNVEPNYQQSIERAYENAIVSAGVSWIADNAAGVPLVLRRKLPNGDLEDVDNHPAIDLLEKPSEFYTWRELLTVAVASIFYAKHGSAFLYKDRNALGRPMGLMYLPYSRVEIKGSATQLITHYRYTPDGVPSQDIPAEDMVHLRLGIDPRNPRLGICPLASLGRELWIDEEASRATATLLRKLAIIGHVLALKDGSAILTEDQLATVKSYVDMEFTGLKRGGTAVLGAPLTLERPQYNPNDLDFSAIRNVVEERATAVLRIAADLLGLGAGLQQTRVGATAESHALAAWTNRMIPMLVSLAGQLTSQLLPDFEPDPNEFEFEFDLSGVAALQPDLKSEAERHSILVGSQIESLEVARQELGIEVADGDTLALPLNITLVPAGQQAALPDPAEEPDDEEDEPQEASLRDLLAKRFGSRQKADLNDQQRALLEADRRLAAQLEGVFTGELEREFLDLGEQIAAIFEQLYVESDTAVAGNQPLAAKRWELDQHTGLLVEVSTKQEPEPGDVRIVSDIFLRLDPTAWRAEALGPKYRTHYLRLLTGTVNNLNFVLGLGVNLPDPVAREVIAKGGTRLGLLDIEGDTRQSIYRSLAAGRAEGEGPRALARRIRAQVPAGRYANAGAQYRAETIARTETKYAQNVSSLEAYRASDVITGLVAVDNQTGFNDADCVARDGQPLTFEEAELELAAEHPNGTLSFSPMVER